jgi:hypothetical protein
MKNAVRHALRGGRLRLTLELPMMRLASLAPIALLVLGGCSSAPSTAHMAVPAAPPPKDDGSPSQGGHGGTSHAAALEQLKAAKLEGRLDKQNSVRVPLPDAPNWTRVKFWGVPSLVGFRYGKDHHAIFGGWIIEVDDNAVEGACTRAFERLAKPVAETFDVELEHEPPSAFTWKFRSEPTVHVVGVDSVFARTATLAARDRYAGAYASYPVWKGRCLVMGVAVPVRQDEPRARQVRDRFVKDVFPKIEVLAQEEPKDRY